MPNFSDLFGGGGGIKSIQRGVIAWSYGDATEAYPAVAWITAVNPAKTELRMLGVTGTTDLPGHVRIYLASATQVAAIAGGGDSGRQTAAKVSWELTEWN